MQAIKKLKEHWQISSIILVFILVKLAFALRFHGLLWDEAVYLSIGKYLFSFGGQGLWEIIRPPGLPLLLGLIWKTTSNYLFYSEILINMFAAGSIFLVYLLGSDLHSKETGLIAAFLLAITPVFFLYSGFILTGIPSAFFIILATYLAFKKKFLYAGITAGIASQFRFPQGLFLVSFCAALIATHFIVKNKNLIKDLKQFILAFGGIHIPFFIFNFFKYNAETSRIHHAIFRPWILGRTHTANPSEALNIPFIEKFLYYPIQLFKDNEIFIFFILGLIFYITLKKYKDVRFNILISTLIFYLAFFTSIINKQLRFSLSFLFIICLFSAFAIMHLIEFLSKYQHKHKLLNKKTLFAIVCIIIFFFSYQYIIPEDEKYLYWRSTTEPVMVDELYRFPSKQGITTPILTADPIFGVYNDNLFHPIYFSLGLANQAYDLYHEEAEYLIYTNETFYCVDEWCEEEAIKFEKKIANHEIIFNKTYGADEYGYREYYIYKLT